MEPPPGQPRGPLVRLWAKAPQLPSAAPHLPRARVPRLLLLPAVPLMALSGPRLLEGRPRLREGARHGTGSGVLGATAVPGTGEVAAGRVLQEGGRRSLLQRQ